MTKALASKWNHKLFLTKMLCAHLQPREYHHCSLNYCLTKANLTIHLYWYLSLFFVQRPFFKFQQDYIFFKEITLYTRSILQLWRCISRIVDFISLKMNNVLRPFGFNNSFLTPFIHLQYRCEISVCSQRYEWRTRLHSKDHRTRIFECVQPLRYVELGLWFSDDSKRQDLVKRFKKKAWNPIWSCGDAKKNVLADFFSVLDISIVMSADTAKHVPCLTIPSLSPLFDDCARIPRQEHVATLMPSSIFGNHSWSNTFFATSLHTVPVRPCLWSYITGYLIFGTSPCRTWRSEKRNPWFRLLSTSAISAPASGSSQIL